MDKKIFLKNTKQELSEDDLRRSEASVASLTSLLVTKLKVINTTIFQINEQIMGLREKVEKSQSYDRSVEMGPSKISGSTGTGHFDSLMSRSADNEACFGGKR